jgi:GMP synthase-like glutamine amidotransferase
MNPVLIFRHVACEGPGYLAEFLARHSVPFELVPIDEGAPVPRALGRVSGLVFMGGPMSVNDDLPWIGDELALVRRAAEANLPVLGHCLGGQLISRAMGGSVDPNSRREIGWFPVERQDSAAASEWLGHLPSHFPVFHWHGETFSIPDGAKLILRSAACAHQAFVLDKILALQCHVEMTPEMVTEWAQRYADELSQPAESVQSFHQITDRLTERTEALQRVADVLYSRWIRTLPG